MDAAVAKHIEQKLRWGGEWSSLGWEAASDAFMTRVWAQHGAGIAERLASVSEWYAKDQRIPVWIEGTLEIRQGSGLSGAELLLPTLAGWQAFLEAAPRSGLKFGALEEAGMYWWGRRIPRDLLSAGRKEHGDEGTSAEWEGR